MKTYTEEQLYIVLKDPGTLFSSSKGRNGDGLFYEAHLNGEVYLITKDVYELNIRSNSSLLSRK